MSTPDLSIVIPAYNEEERLGATLGMLGRFAAEREEVVELIFVDDGSSDGTADLLADFQPPELRCPPRLLRSPQNRGKGHAVRQGMLAARGEQILFSDADLSTPLGELDRLQQALAGAKVAIGSRALAQSRIVKSQSRVRVLGGKALNLAVQLLALPGIHDTQCGFKLFTREAAQAIFRRATIDGFAFDVEVLYLARRLGFQVAEVPVEWHNAEGSKVDPLMDGLRLLRDVLRVRWRGVGEPTSEAEI
ncbi:MAG: dolichyl-phosphate beta-glucosyltransferase [Acidobacteriota bacterium]